ncbi:hypothetical protein A4G24_16685 [Elizabethkingia anophelis]|nr:hypothetical protein A4G24_16685 [Elizabethkingia anophelis]
MRSLSYIIILMSLIGSYQSESTSCTFRSLGKYYEKQQGECFKVDQASVHIEKLNRFVSLTFFKLKENQQKQDFCFRDLYTVKALIFDKNNRTVFLSSPFKIESKLSKIRNKDYLDLVYKI